MFPARIIVLIVLWGCIIMTAALFPHLTLFAAGIGVIACVYCIIKELTS